MPYWFVFNLILRVDGRHRLAKGTEDMLEEDDDDDDAALLVLCLDDASSSDDVAFISIVQSCMCCRLAD